MSKASERSGGETRDFQRRSSSRKADKLVGGVLLPCCRFRRLISCFASGKLSEEDAKPKPPQDAGVARTEEIFCLNVTQYEMHKERYKHDQETMKTRTGGNEEDPAGPGHSCG